MFSAGGPATSIRAIREDGGLGEQIEELYSVLDEEILNVYKTRAAVVSLPCLVLPAVSSSFEFMRLAKPNWLTNSVRVPFRIAK